MIFGLLEKMSFSGPDPLMATMAEAEKATAALAVAGPTTTAVTAEAKATTSRQ